MGRNPQIEFEAALFQVINSVDAFKETRSLDGGIMRYAGSPLTAILPDDIVRYAACRTFLRRGRGFRNESIG